AGGVAAVEEVGQGPQEPGDVVVELADARQAQEGALGGAAELPADVVGRVGLVVDRVVLVAADAAGAVQPVEVEILDAEAAGLGGEGFLEPQVGVEALAAADVEEGPVVAEGPGVVEDQVAEDAGAPLALAEALDVGRPAAAGAGLEQQHRSSVVGSFLYCDE